MARGAYSIMTMALTEAANAAAHGEVPVGAVIVNGADGELLARAGNRVEATADPTAHAELLALREAAASAGSSRLDGATLVSTLEPCVMCAGAALLSRVARVVFGTPDPKAGALGSLYNIGADPRLNHEFEITVGVRADECAELLSNFFADKRS